MTIQRQATNAVASNIDLTAVTSSTCRCFHSFTVCIIRASTDCPYVHHNPYHSAFLHHRNATDHQHHTTCTADITDVDAFACYRADSSDRNSIHVEHCKKDAGFGYSCRSLSFGDDSDPTHPSDGPSY